MLRRSETTLSPLIVVDNGDGAECRAALAAFGGDVTVLATGANLGFSGGCNAGIREALASGAGAVLLVNSDVDRAARLRDAPGGCAGQASAPRHRRPGRAQPQSGPDGCCRLVSTTTPRTGRMRQREDRSDAVASTAVSGCVMLVHRDVFDRIGLLPEEYFFSFEDIAFCQRARAAGFDVGLARDATAYHEGGATMGASPERLYYAARNHLRLGAQTPSRSSWHQPATTVRHRGVQRGACDDRRRGHGGETAAGGWPRHRRSRARSLRQTVIGPDCHEAADDPPDRGQTDDGLEWAEQMEPSAARREAIERTLDERARQQRRH